MKPVHIIILCWNAVEFTKKCFSSLLPGLRQKDRITFVNNGSTDNTKKYLRKISRRDKRINVIENKDNLGFTKGVNLGVDCVKSGYDIVLLNNDLEDFDKNWIEKLQQQAFDIDKCGVLGVKQYNYNEQNKKIIVHFGAFTLPESKQGWPYHCHEEDVGQCRVNTEVEHVNFAAVYIREELKKEVMEKDGFFLDESFHSYCEDDDFCLRARNYGWKVFVTPVIELRHHTNVSTRENKVSQPELHQKSISIYKNKWNKHYEDKYEKEVSIQTLTAFESGYARSGRYLIDALERHNVKVNYSYVYGTKYSEPIIQNKLVDDIRWNRSAKASDVQIVFGQGDVMNKNSSKKYRIGYTMLETTDIPKEWVKQLNEMDEVWAPSEFNKATFQESGVNKPIYVIPLGIDPIYINPDIIPYEKKYDMPFNFLSVGEWGERKNFLTLLQIFSAYFQEYKKEAGLTIRYSSNDPYMNPGILDQISMLNLPIDRPSIRFIKNDYQDQQSNFQIPYYRMASLYNYNDVYVTPTCGEGFGLPIFEALACGLPVVATGWSSYVEYLLDSSGKPLPGVKLVNYSLQPARAKCPYYGPESFWAQVDPTDFGNSMLEVFENFEEYKKGALETSIYIRENINWDVSAKKIIERLNEIGL